MIGLMIGKVELQEVQAGIQSLDKSEPTCEGVNEPDAAAGDGMRAAGNFKVDVAGGPDGLRTTAEVCRVEAALDPPLAVRESSSYERLHSQSSRAADARQS